MLPFSEYLRELLDVKKVTVSSVARLIGVERTAISKTLTGQRVLPYNALDALIYHLRLTPGEENRLRSCYETQFEQEGVRRSRELIAKLFTEFADLDFSTPDFEETKLLLNLEQYAAGRSVFSGIPNVQRLLRMVLTEENARPDACIQMTVPPTYGFLNSELIHRYLGGQMTAEISQIIAFDSSGSVEDINLHNLDCFCRVLPSCLLSMRHYHPYYYYDDNVSSRYTDPFPYFLLAHNCVICLSEDCAQAMLLTGEDQVSYYHRHFQELLDRCHSLIRYTSDPVEILSVYDQITDRDGFYMVMDQPCFGRFYTDEIIERGMRQDLPFREVLAQVAKQRFGNLRQVDKFFTLFTESGLERMASTGMLDDFPETVVYPFTKEELRNLFTWLADAIRSGDVTGRLIAKGTFPDYLSMTTSKGSGVGIFTTEKFPSQDDFCSIQIQETGLCQALHDWLTHLPSSRATLGAEETAEVLEKLARRLAPGFQEDKRGEHP